MDTVQILTIDIPVKSKLFINHPDKISDYLKEHAMKYLDNNNNYYANGVVYKDTIEVIEWNSGIKRGSNLSDEMIFTTKIRACFRMYPIGTMHTGMIESVENNMITINTEYKYNIIVPFVKMPEGVDVSAVIPDDEDDDYKKETKKHLKNNNKTYPYISNTVNIDKLKRGTTVEFIVLDVDSRFNNDNIIVLSFISNIIEHYTKIYSCSCNKINNIIPEYKHIAGAFDINAIVPLYAVNNDPHINIVQLDNPDIDANTITNAITSQLNYKDSLIIYLTLNKNVMNPINENLFNSLCKKFVNITVYYDWTYGNENEYRMIIVGSYYH